MDIDKDELAMDPAWPYLQIVYDLLLKFVASSNTDPKVVKKYLDHSFVFRLLELFDYEGPREREALKKILCRIYRKFMVHWPFIRKTFIEKEPKLAGTVIKGLLKYWPATNSQKEVMFLGELEEVLEVTNGVEFQRTMVPLFRRITLRINNSHFHVKISLFSYL
ncbi:hypothetical protein AMTR_s00031p00154390 [Amborella trichopoda]|uniref:Uncharacterized protein n=1 Tax=Amborella trichopoda TaxID=13333 RepID=U5D2B9_AMBTC|nr:hypothetical protein AMTR_s00031p00154390 [Amborella trichopoda]